MVAGQDIKPMELEQIRYAVTHGIQVEYRHLGWRGIKKDRNAFMGTLGGENDNGYFYFTGDNGMNGKFEGLVSPDRLFLPQQELNCRARE